MAYSASDQSSASFWEVNLADLFFPPAQSAAPQATQDADLLRQLNFVPGLKEILMLRQVHALEHATVWVLSEMNRSPSSRLSGRPPADNELLSGMSTDRGFYLYGEVRTENLSRAVQTALRRITAGDWDLAVHPRCGTNLSVGMLLTASFALGTSLLLPRGPIEQILGLGVATAVAAQLAPDLGSLAQRYITTSIPFNLAIAHIATVQDHLHRPTHFVQVRWIE